MKKLHKKNTRVDSVEAFYCACDCQSETCLCDCMSMAEMMVIIGAQSRDLYVNLADARRGARV